MHVVHRFRQSDAHCRHAGRGEIVCAEQGEEAGDHRLYGARGRPQAQRDLLQFPAIAECGAHRVGRAAVGVSVEDAPILMREDFRRGAEALRGEQAGEEARERAARLVELDGRRTPVREGARRLAARQSEGVALPVGIEAQQLAGGGRATERADDAGRMPAARAEGLVVGAEPDAHGGFQACGNRGDECAAIGARSLGDGERGRHDLRRGVAQRGTVDIAHGHGGDQVTIEQRGAGERELLAADHRRFMRGAKRSGERADLGAFVALPAGDRARDRIEHKVLHALANARRQVVVPQAGDEPRELAGRRRRHSSFAPESFTAFAHLTSSALISALNSSGVQIAGSAARLTRRSRISGSA